MYGDPGRFRQYAGYGDDGGVAVDEPYYGRPDPVPQFSPQAPLPSMQVNGGGGSQGGSGLLGAVAETGQQKAADWMWSKGEAGVEAAKSWLSRPTTRATPSAPMNVGDYFSIPSMAGMPADTMGFGQMIASGGGPGATGVQVAQQALGAGAAGAGVTGAATAAAPAVGAASAAAPAALGAAGGAGAAGAAGAAGVAGAGALLGSGAGAAGMAGLGAALLAFL